MKSTLASLLLIIIPINIVKDLLKFISEIFQNAKEKQTKEDINGETKTKRKKTFSVLHLPLFTHKATDLIITFYGILIKKKKKKESP